MTETAHTLPRSAGETREFRRSILPTVLGGVITTALLSVVALFLIPAFVPPTMSISGRMLLFVAVVVVLIIVVGGTLFWLRDIRVIVTADAVTIGRAGSRQTFARDTSVFRSRITEHRTNGFRTGTTRALIVHSGGRETSFELPGFSRTTFNELMATLAPLAPALPADPVVAARARAQVRRDFTLDATRERRLGMILLAVCAVLIVATIGIVLWVLSLGELTEDSIGILLAPPFAICATGFGIGGVRRLRNAGRAPRRLTVGHQGLRLDEVEHAYAQLARIWVTPPSYGGPKRMRIERRGGRPVAVTLAAPRIALSPDYEEFVVALRSETAAYPGLLSLDLE